MKRSKKNKHRAEPGTITEKQVSYIEYLFLDMSTQASAEILYNTIEGYDGELETLSSEQARKLLGVIVARKKIAEKAEA